MFTSSYPELQVRIVPTSTINVYQLQRKSVRFDTNDEVDEDEEEDKRSKRRIGYASGCCCTSSNGFTKLGLALMITGVLFLVIVAAIIPLVFILKNNAGNKQFNLTKIVTTNEFDIIYGFSLTLGSNQSSSSSNVNVPKRLGIYYGWPSLVQGVQGNLTAAISIFSQFDLVVFGDGIASPSHGDHTNTQTIIQSLNNLGKLTFGYIDLGVTTQNLTILQMQTTVDEWAAMGINGILWDDAGYDYNVSRSRQNTMISYCHSLNLRVMMNAWNPDDVMSGSPMLLGSDDIYLLESYLISNGNYQSLAAWKIKADKCLLYASLYGISMATLSTSSTPISPSFGLTQQFSQAWFGTVIYNFQYFQATDIQYSASNNVLYAFENLLTSYGNSWQTADVQNDSNIHFYRSTDIYILQIYGDGVTYGNGSFTLLSNG
ncbi:unnamed protein product [Rotaria magnacalcarata]